MQRESMCSPSHCPRLALLDAKRFNATTDEQRRKRVADDIQALLANGRGQGAIDAIVINPLGEERNGKMCGADWRRTGTQPIQGRRPVTPMYIGFKEEPANYLLPPPAENAAEI